jgi:hypothetical protein
MAPRTERSASRLLGRGFSSVVCAVAIAEIRFTFAYVSTSLSSAQDWLARLDGENIFSGRETYAGLDIPCVLLER